MPEVTELAFGVRVRFTPAEVRLARTDAALITAARDAAHWVDTRNGTLSAVNHLEGRTHVTLTRLSARSL